MLWFGFLLLCAASAPVLRFSGQASGRPGGGMSGAAAGKGLRLTAVFNH